MLMCLNTFTDSFSPSIFFLAMKCAGGRVYMPCSPSGGQPTCGTVIEQPESSSACEEGCYCPEGTVWHNSACITKDRCSCRLRGKDFPPGSTLPKDCNTCTCVDGKWVCTQASKRNFGIRLKFLKKKLRFHVVRDVRL